MDSRCEICPAKYACIPSDGPVEASIMVIAERPGQFEEANARKGYRGYGPRRCLVGPTGDEWNNNYLRLAGLDRDDLRVTNTVRCGSDHNKKPTAKEIASCSAHFLEEELQQVQPKVLILMGSTACSLLPLSGGDEVDLDVVHGIPQWGRVLGWEGWIVPQYHPALGLHQTGAMTHLLADWERLGMWLKANKDCNFDAKTFHELYRTTDYRLASSWRDVASYFEQFISSTQRLVAVDTESHAGRPWSVQVSIQKNTGLMIPIEMEGALDVMVQFLQDYKDGALVFHHAPADLGLLNSLGWTGPYRDTMQEAYQLSNLPQGLKALGYRLLGIKMQSWEDLVLPCSKDKLVDQLLDALMLTEQKPDVTYKQLKTKLKEVRRPSFAESKLRWIIQHTMSNPGYDPWEKLEEWDLKGRLHEMGIVVPQWVQKGIANVPIEQAVEYGCLSGESRVLTEEGYLPIGDIVKKKLLVRVASSNTDGELEYKPITGWYRNQSKKHVRWMSIETDISRVGKWGNSGTRYTPDHRLLTPNGWKAVEDLEVGDVIYHPTERMDSVQRQIVLGSMLGDGCLAHRNSGGWSTMVFSNNTRQLGYVEWKYRCLGNLVQAPMTTSRPRPSWIKNSGRWTRPNIQHYVHTIHHPELLRLRLESYPSTTGKRVGPWINDLKLLGLAVWYQDDGTIARYGQSGQPRFYTNSYPKEDTESLCDMLSERFGLDPSMILVRDVPKQWAITLLGRSCDVFFEQISPFVHPCMQYKLPPFWKGRFKPTTNPVKLGLVEAVVQRVYINPSEGTSGKRGAIKTTYCIDVEKNHNFFTHGEVAHNCRDADVTLQVAMEFDRMRPVVEGEWNVQSYDYDK